MIKGIDKKFNMDGDELEGDLIEEIEIIPEECTFDKKNPDNDIYEDYEYVRKKLRYVIAACETVLGRAMTELAVQPSPRVVEGCSTIIKTITESTSQLLDVHGKIKKMNIIKEPDSNTEGDETKGVKANINDIMAAFEDEDDNYNFEE